MLSSYHFMWLYQQFKESTHLQIQTSKKRTDFLLARMETYQILQSVALFEPPLSFGDSSSSSVGTERQILAATKFAEGKKIAKLSYVNFIELSGRTV